VFLKLFAMAKQIRKKAPLENVSRPSILNDFLPLYSNIKAKQVELNKKGLWRKKWGVLNVIQDFR
jgi:hypothetical protein